MFLDFLFMTDNLKYLTLSLVFVFKSHYTVDPSFLKKTISPSKINTIREGLGLRWTCLTCLFIHLKGLYSINLAHLMPQGIGHQKPNLAAKDLALQQ